MQDSKAVDWNNRQETRFKKTTGWGKFSKLKRKLKEGWTTKTRGANRQTDNKRRKKTDWNTQRREDGWGRGQTNKTMWKNTKTGSVNHSKTKANKPFKIRQETFTLKSQTVLKNRFRYFPWCHIKVVLVTFKWPSQRPLFNTVFRPL